MRDLRVLNAIARKMAKENNVSLGNFWIHPTYKYVVTVNFDLKDLDFCSTEYKGKAYKCNYVSGCFNPYIIAIN
jgi:hypothetical protein